jgi:hypothetical protein
MSTDRFILPEDTFEIFEPENSRSPLLDKSVDGYAKGWERTTGWRITDGTPCMHGCWIHSGRCCCLDPEFDTDDDGWRDHTFCVVSPEGRRYYLAQPYAFHPKSAADLTAWCRRNKLTWSIGHPPSFWFPTVTVPILISKERVDAPNDDQLAFEFNGRGM